MTGWFGRLKQGLKRTSSRLGQGIAQLFTGRKLDAESLAGLEELLISADLGVPAAARLVKKLSDAKLQGDSEAEKVKEILAGEIAAILAPVARSYTPDPAKKPNIVLVVGVNGSGKTTTIGKLAQFYRDQKLSVVLAAGDTFRAAAVEQLKLWGQRTGVPVHAGTPGGDAAGLVYDALQAARAAKADILMIDTAGRLHNKDTLMAELQKIIRVLRKLEPEAPHEVLLVLDATVGQNAHRQVEVFREMVGVTGLVMTKLDGTAKGGVLVGLAERFGLPVRFIGVGEGVEDLRPFAAEDFAKGLLGLD